MMLKTTIAAFLAFAAATATAAIIHEAECTPCEGTTGTCVVKSKVNFFAGQTGYFEFEGCDGVNPTLLLTVGRTYKFDQSDDTNWYHLLGFAYEADGAHVPVDELEPGISRGGNTCDIDASCPAPMYFRNGEYAGSYSNIPEIKNVTSNDEDFGLDAVEPLFFHPFRDWQSYGAMETYLNYDFPLAQDFFYFCHIHSGMSGRIKLIDADGNKLSAENTPELPYEYNKVAEFDEVCGTYNLTDFQPSKDNNMCPPMFICTSDEAEMSQYAKCVEAMNCHMMSSMTTNAGGGVLELFNHQMIPHHENAINMAKSFLKLHAENAVCNEVEEGAEVSWECELIPIFLDIINGQNSQIIDMKDALEQLGSTEYANCEVDFSGVVVSRNRRLQEEPAPGASESVFESGVDCQPCADTFGECEVKVKVDLMAGELGYFTVDGCSGVNPTLHLSINRTYKFDQSDKSNWYHLIGFSYFADGAHIGVDELEPGVAPGDSSCAETMSCPAPMYTMDGVYQGSYSNIPDILNISTGENDFGLDKVEPRFFHPLGDWEEYGPFVTFLNFDSNYDQDIFYFCHVHSEMTGRIKLLDANGNMLSKENKPEIPYEYNVIGNYDETCGTFDLERFRLPNNQCPEHFVCGDESDTTLGTFSNCVDAMNCFMLDGMTTTYGGDGGGSTISNDAILFLRQMIPHHQNAVNMAKATLKLGGISCGEGSDVGVDCLLDPIVRGIINSQNKQIQTMKSLLTDVFEVSEFGDCDVPKNATDSGRSGANSVFRGTFFALIAAGVAITFM